MKKILIIINSVLIFLLGLSIWGLIYSATRPDEVAAVKKKKKDKTATHTATSASANKNIAKFTFPDNASACNTIVRKNIFDANRVGGGIGRGAQTYQLVGVTSVGNFKSATILIKGGLRHNNGRQLQQHLRIGDALPNGYVLSEVYNDSVVLTRGAAKMELHHTLPSENFPTGGGRRRAPNQMQQMLDLMRQQMGMQQRQQRDMMQMMRNQQNNSSGGRGRSTNNRGRR